MTPRIRFNGTEYESPEAMPPAVRAAYQKALELARQAGTGGLLGGNVKVKVSTNMRIVHNGQTYDSIDALPPELRAKYQAALHQVDKDGNGVPDFLEAGSASPAAPQSAPVDPLFDQSPTPAIAPLSSQPPVITGDGPHNRLLIVSGLVIVLLLLVALGLAAYIFMH